MSLKAIETLYRGCRFRSRTEARWAVFFDAMEIEWHYEKEGFDLPSGRYLPDFWLPRVGGGCWFEVKGQEPTERERALAHELADASKLPVFIFAGHVRAELKLYQGSQINRQPESLGIFGFDEQIIVQPDGLGFFPYERSEFPRERFSICANCGLVGIVGVGAACYLPCQDNTWKLCRHCHKPIDKHHHRIDGDDDTDFECCNGTEYFSPPCGCPPLPARKFLIDRGEERSSWQTEILSRRCDCGGLQLRKQQSRLKAAYDKASSARFEFGEKG